MLISRAMRMLKKLERSRWDSGVLGVGLLVLFNLLSAVKVVYLGAFVQRWHPLIAMLFCFAFASLFYGAIAALQKKGTLLKVRAHFKSVLLLNLTSTAAWLGFFYSLKDMEPAVADVIIFSLGPILTVLFWRVFRPQTVPSSVERWSAVGITVSLSLVAYATAQGQSGVGALSYRALTWGILFSVLSGAGVAGNTIYMKRLSEAGFTVAEVMATRFPLLLLTGLLVWPAGWTVASLGADFYLGVLFLSGAGVILPLYLLQKSIEKLEPISVALLLTLLPVFTYVMQIFDPRLQLSLISGAGVTLAVSFALWGVLSRTRAERKRKCVAIVDAYSAANQFAAFFHDKGYRCVHVQSCEPIPDVYVSSFRPGEFHDEVIFRGDLGQTAAALRRLGVCEVIAGIETGVELADALSEAMGLTSNGTKLSRARRDKYEMAEAIMRKGLRAAKQCKSSEVETILMWAALNRVNPVVIKPVDSAGTDSVFVCKDKAEIRAAFQAIHGHANRLGLLNTHVLAQEYIRGKEHVINTVSHHGERYVTSIVRYNKLALPDGTLIYDYDEFLDGTGDTEKALVSYTFKVLDALEIQNGPAHAEVYMTENGPVLMEVAARIDGLAFKEIENKLTGLGQVELTVDSYVDPGAFHRRTAKPFELKTNMLVVFGISEQEGLVTAMPGIRRIEGLESFSSATWKLKIGSLIHKTHDLFTCPSYVVLSHASKETLMRDYRTIRQWEKTHEIYTVQALSLAATEEESEHTLA